MIISYFLYKFWEGLEDKVDFWRSWVIEEKINMILAVIVLFITMMCYIYTVTVYSVDLECYSSDVMRGREECPKD